MMVCHCTLAGTAACRNCGRYQIHYGDSYYRPPMKTSPMIPEIEKVESLEDMIRRIIKEEK